MEGLDGTLCAFFFGLKYTISTGVLVVACFWQARLLPNMGVYIHIYIYIYYTYTLLEFERFIPNIEDIVPDIRMYA